MTDKKSDNETTKPAPAPAAATVQPPKSTDLAKPTPAPAPPPKSGRGLAGLALLIALGAAGGGGYLWYLRQQDQAAQANQLEQAIKQAIAGGLGISVLSRHTLALEAGQGPLLVLDVATFPLMRQWYVAYPAGKHLSAVAEAFLAHLLQARA